MEKIENEGKRLSIWKFLIGTTCHLEELDATENLGIFLLEVASLEANNVTVTSSMMHTMYVYSMDGGEWNGTRTNLTTNMQQMCHGLPIRMVSKQALTQEEFEALVGISGGRKKKRAMMRAAHCCAACGCQCFSNGCPDWMLQAQPMEMQQARPMQMQMAKRNADDVTTTQAPSDLDMIHWIVVSDD